PAPTLESRSESTMPPTVPTADDRPSLPAASNGAGRARAARIALGIGAAGLVIGGIAGLEGLSKQGDLDRHCTPAHACDPAGLELASSQHTWSHVNTVAWVIGAAAAGVGGYLLWTRPSSGSVVQAAPQVLAQGGGLAVWGRF